MIVPIAVSVSVNVPIIQNYISGKPLMRNHSHERPLLNFISVPQFKCYLRLKISVQGPFKTTFFINSFACLYFHVNEPLFLPSVMTACYETQNTGEWSMLWWSEERLDGQHRRADVPAYGSTGHCSLLQKRQVEDLCGIIPHPWPLPPPPSDPIGQGTELIC